MEEDYAVGGRTSITVYEAELELLKSAKRDLERELDTDLSMHEAITLFAKRAADGTDHGDWCPHCHIFGERCVKCYVNDLMIGHMERADGVTQNAVYVLKCFNPYETPADLDESADFATGPVAQAIEYEDIYYVGFSTDLPNRALTHFVGATTASPFTKSYPPEDIHAIHWFETEGEAKSNESVIANQLREDKPDAFVWQG